MDCQQFTIELIKYGAWPLVVCLGIFLLKDRLAGMFSGGIKSLQHGQTKVELFDKNQNLKPEYSDSSQLDSLIPVDNTGLSADLEKILTESISSVTENEQKIDILVKKLAQTQIHLGFEKVYTHIYGSQIRLLEFLCTKPNGETEIVNVLSFYYEATKSSPEYFQNLNFSEYSEFLKSWKLINSLNDKISITQAGRAFIDYITTLKYYKDRAF